jgi:hypothetical protein
VFTVMIAAPMDGIPHWVADELSERMAEIASSLDSVLARERESPLVKSLQLTGLLLEIGQWRFIYSIDAAGQCVVVEQAVLKMTG